MEKQITYIDIISRVTSFFPVITEEEINKFPELVIGPAKFILNKKIYPIDRYVIDSSDLWLDYISGTYKKSENDCNPGSFKVVSTSGDKIGILRFVGEKSVFKRVINEIAQFRLRI